MRLKFLKLIICFFFISNCGFKVSTLESNYKIASIETSGDQRINYVLKNELLRSSRNNNEENLVKIKINSTKNKSIKEKNIKNEVTKYTLSFKIDVHYNELNKGLKNNFSVTRIGDYNVASRYSDTINNEKNLTRLMIENISEEIVERLSLLN